MKQKYNSKKQKKKEKNVEFRAHLSLSIAKKNDTCAHENVRARAQPVVKSI